MRTGIRLSPPPPVRTVRLAESTKPLICSAAIFGGMASAGGLVTTSTSAGPSCAKAARSASRTWAGFSTRMPRAPAAVAMAA